LNKTPKDYSNPLFLETVKHYLRELISVAVFFHAHMEGQHRDIKPGNILYYYDKDGDVRFKLSDFGLSKIKTQGNEDPSLFIAGTPEYMAPEINEGAGIAENSDLYSIGVIGIQMLTGLKHRDIKVGRQEISDVPDQQLKSILIGLFCTVDKRLSWEEMMLHDFMIAEDGTEKRELEVCSYFETCYKMFVSRNKRMLRLLDYNSRKFILREISVEQATTTLENDMNRRMAKEYEEGTLSKNRIALIRQNQVRERQLLDLEKNIDNVEELLSYDESIDDNEFVVMFANVISIFEIILRNQPVPDNFRSSFENSLIVVENFMSKVQKRMFVFDKLLMSGATKAIIKLKSNIDENILEMVNDLGEKLNKHRE